MNPYENLPPRAFWRQGVADALPTGADLWMPKFRIRPETPVAMFGSCFAQHIGAALKHRGYNRLVTEPPPRGLRDDGIKLFNYDIFSCRTGNIYTTSLLKQWVSWAADADKPPEETWWRDGKAVDPFRPRIEPEGFADEAEMRQSRQTAIAAFRDSIVKTEVFVFTLGLTESWFHRDGYEYPMCPGTAGGDYDADVHRFVNQDHASVLRHLKTAVAIMRRLNSRLKIILTVSPVPLVATAGGGHVLTATTYSKSVLRAVAGQMAASHAFVDYFPSYEIITSPVYGGKFFEADRRRVSPHGVEFVMTGFFDAMDAAPQPARSDSLTTEAPEDDVVCEEELLAAFGGRT